MNDIIEAGKLLAEAFRSVDAKRMVKVNPPALWGIISDTLGGHKYDRIKKMMRRGLESHVYLRLVENGTDDNNLKAQIFTLTEQELFTEENARQSLAVFMIAIDPSDECIGKMEKFLASTEEKAPQSTEPKQTAQPQSTEPGQTTTQPQNPQPQPTTPQTGTTTPEAQKGVPLQTTTPVTQKGTPLQTTAPVTTGGVSDFDIVNGVLRKYKGNSAEVVVPNGVKKIEKNAFFGCTSVKSVTIPNSVTEFGEGAFSGCSSLESMTLPFIGMRKNAVYQHPLGYLFGKTFFEGGVLVEQDWYDGYSEAHSVTYCIPSSLKKIIVTGSEISKGTFVGCEGLTYISLLAANVIRDAVFSGCKNLSDVVLSPDVRFIGIGAFKDCESLEKINIPSKVKEIQTSTFSGCKSLASVTIPNGVTKIGNYAFQDCKGLTSITIPDSVTIIGWDAFIDCTSLTTVNMPENVKLGDRAFENCPNKYNPQRVEQSSGSSAEVESKSESSVTTSAPISNSNFDIENGVLKKYNGREASVVIPDGVTAIGKRAFKECKGLRNVKIPNSVTGIDEYAFYGCESLTSISIPDSVATIGFAAFGDCTGLTSITIGDSVLEIDGSIFGGCTNIESISVARGNKNYHSSGNCLIETSAKTLIRGCKNSIIPDDGSVISIGSGAFAGCERLTKIAIPDCIKRIEYCAFNYCTHLSSVIIPDGITEIDVDTFWGCSSLTSIRIPDTVTKIGVNAFRGCEKLESINIPDGVTEIGDRAFDGCKGIKKVVIPDGVISVGEQAFEDCTNLETISIPKSVKTIGENAFRRCHKLTIYKAGGLNIFEQMFGTKWNPDKRPVKKL